MVACPPKHRILVQNRLHFRLPRKVFATFPRIGSTAHITKARHICHHHLRSPPTLTFFPHIDFSIDSIDFSALLCSQNGFVAKQPNKLCFGCKTLEYGTFCYKTLRYGIICRKRTLRADSTFYPALQKGTSLHGVKSSCLVALKSTELWLFVSISSISFAASTVTWSIAGKNTKGVVSKEFNFYILAPFHQAKGL